jgi:hypothetical protein
VAAIAPQVWLGFEPPEVPLRTSGSGLNPGAIAVCELAAPVLVKSIAKAAGTTIQFLNSFIGYLPLETPS